MVARRVVRQSSSFTGRSLGWRALLAAALRARESGNIAKAEELTRNAIDSARKYLEPEDIELVPLYTILADLCKKQDKTEEEAWALSQLRLSLRSIEPESESES